MIVYLDDKGTHLSGEIKKHFSKCNQQLFWKEDYDDFEGDLFNKKQLSKITNYLTERLPNIKIVIYEYYHSDCIEDEYYSYLVAIKPFRSKKDQDYFSFLTSNGITFD